MSIKNKIAFSFIGLVSIILISQMIFNNFYAKEFYIKEKSNAMEQSFYEIEKLYDGTSESIENVALEFENKYNFNILVSDNKNELIYVTENRNMVQYAVRPLVKSYKIKPDLSISDQNPIITTLHTPPNNSQALMLYGEFDFQNDKNFIQITVPMDSIENSVGIFTKASTTISIIALLIAVLYSFIISRGITKPISDIEKIASNCANLDFSMLANENIASLEIANLATNINSMSKQLEKTINELNIANEKLQNDIANERKIEQMRREFIANVSHEMKTPLALLQIYSSNLKSNVENIDKDYYCETIIEETERLNDMVVSMLDISSIESGLSKMNFSEISISILCLSVVDKFMPVLEDFNLTIDIQSNLNIIGDAKYLEQAMKNYISNAISHTEKDKKINISLLKNDDDVIFGIFNEGNNISEGDILYIWDSFYKSDKSRVRSGNNAGLGLYIVKTIINAHNGACNVRNDNNGVIFEFKIKLY